MAAATGGTVVDVTGTGGARTVTGVADGLVAAASRDAVNGSQLATTNAAVVNLSTLVVSQGLGFVSSNNAGALGPVASGANASAGGAGAVASGSQSLAMGNGSAAVAANTVAVGAGAVSTGTNSVALGAGSRDDGATNVVSVGSAFATRRITNVAPGTSASDAANVGQLQSGLTAGLAASNAYTDSRISALGFDLRNVERDARKGTAAAVAIGYAPMPSAPGRTSYTLNGSTFRGEQAIGGSVAHRFGTAQPFALTAGFAFAGEGNNAARVGVAGEF
ncbi:hypothetical protein GCM10011529_12300 [Polymorphobacter glacialis]|uniref:Trimeric autotransporter adhesin YadA-like stalk domain-containing protein n=1 Tax=Sandarakinorhabdus glacialis TaxID=1614636 RepID=A0A917E5R4_9SPHN|nr:YadA-like family protein [Polymorphobacter glacialis]GGE07422.1 hypothetical protein GCM10011529_12300 [Polymorphobacter glacialis]